MKHEIALKTDKVKELEDALSHKLQTYQTAVIHQDLRRRTDTVLSQQFEQHTCIQESRVQKKLCKLYGGWVPLPRRKDGYVNFSDATLTEDQKELLNLGTKYALTPKFSSRTKKAELEILY